MIYSHTVTIRALDFTVQRIIQAEEIIVNHDRKTVPLQGNPEILEVVQKAINAFSLPPFNATVSIADHKRGIIVDQYKIQELIAENDSDVFVVIRFDDPHDELLRHVPNEDCLYAKSDDIDQTKPAFAHMTLKRYMQDFRKKRTQGVLMISRNVRFTQRNGKDTLDLLFTPVVLKTFDHVFQVMHNMEVMKFFGLEASQDRIIYVKQQLTNDYGDYAKNSYDIIRFQPNHPPVVYKHLTDCYPNDTDMTIIANNFTYMRDNGKCGRLHYVNSDKFLKTRDIDLVNKSMQAHLEAFGKKYDRYLYRGVFYRCEFTHVWVVEDNYDPLVLGIKKTYKIDKPTLEMIYTLKYLVNA